MDNFFSTRSEGVLNAGDQHGVLVETVHLSLPHVNNLALPLNGPSPEIEPESPTALATQTATGEPSRQPLSDLCLVIRSGDRIALTGSSGSGKSVLLRTLALLDRPLRGEVHFGGVSVRPNDIPAYRRAIAYIPQRPSLPGETVRDAFHQPFTLGVRRDQNYDEAEALVWLARAGKPASFLEKTNATLSGGEAQVAALVRTLLLNPQLLLLDEPTAALDPESAAAVEALLNEWFVKNQPTQARAYLWISHDPEQAARVGRVRWHIDAGHMTTPAWSIAPPTTQ